MALSDPELVPVSLLGLLPGQRPRRRSLVDWLSADPVEVATAATLPAGDPTSRWLELAEALNEPDTGRVLLVDYWAAWQATNPAA